MERGTDDIDGAPGGAVLGTLVVATLVPILGLLHLDWGVSTVVFVYWVECGVVIGLGILQMGPAKRVALPLPGGRRYPAVQLKQGTVAPGPIELDLPVRNSRRISYALFVSVFWLATGIAFVIPGSMYHWSTLAPISELAISVTAVSVPHLLYTRRYFRTRAYDSASPFRALNQLGIYTLVIGLTVVVSITQFDNQRPSLADWTTLLLVVGAIGVWTALRCYLYWRLPRKFRPVTWEQDTFDDRPNRDGLLSSVYEVTLPPVDRPSTAPNLVVRPQLRYLALGLGRTGLRVRFFMLLAAVLSVLCGLSGLLVYVLVQDLLAALLLPVTIVVGTLLFIYLPFALAATVSDAIVYPTLAYEFCDDRLVCHDRWLDAPQWTLPYDRIDRVVVARRLTGRLFGVAVIRIETTDDHSATIVYVGDADVLERLLEALGDEGDFGSAVARLEARDRRVLDVEAESRPFAAE